MPRRGLTVVAVTCALATVISGCADGGDQSPSAGSPSARGEQLFATHCVACHGEAGAGTASGPPLVHEIYEPGHHPDDSFHRAVAEGVPAHHWEFGAMPPIPGLGEEEVDDILVYVRELQRDAGIIN